jgi:hypothetical protein
MTVLEASTQCLAHFNSDFRESSARRTLGVQGDATFSVALSGTQAKFGAQSLDAYSANWASLVFKGCGTLIDGDYKTIECWAYYRSHRSNSNFVVLAQATNSAGTRYFRLRTNSSGLPIVDLSDGTANDNPIVGPSALPLNQWVHLVATVSKFNRTRRLFVNGVLVAAGTGTIGTPADDAPAEFRIGPFATGGFFSPDAFIDEARYVYAYPVYELPYALATAAFPNSSGGGDASFSSVSLLLHGDGSNGGTTITDSSSNALTATQSGSSGNVTTSTTNFLFGTASLRFGGTQGITYAASALFEAATRDWTIECAINADSSANQPVIVQFGTSTTNRFSLYFNVTNKTVAFFSQSASGSATHLQTPALDYGKWYRVALTKEGSAVTLWLDGVPVGTVYNPFIPTGNLGVAVGIEPFTLSSTAYFIGYIEEVRLTMGVARQTLNFTPPTSPYADCPQVDGAMKPALNYHKSGSVLSIAPKLSPQNSNLKDVYFGGRGYIIGTVKEKALPSNVPLHRRVRLIRERDGTCIRETWSDATTGNYAFYNIDETLKYTVVTYDYLNNYRAVIADNLTPNV